MPLRNNFRKKLIKTIIVLATIFLLFFVFRLIYGFASYPTGSTIENISSIGNNFGFAQNIKNYATKTRKYDNSPVYDNQKDVSGGDQKYEKIASISSKTKEFDSDEKKLRDIINQYEALIQYENMEGLKPYRKLNMAIGVNPDSFNDMKDVIKEIGILSGISINKIDKTNEYKDLNATRDSLLITKQSLIALKEYGGRIDELIQLENRILDIERQIQSLGVNLGDYDEENEFCTIKVSLNEYYEAKLNNIPFIQRVKVSLEWSIKYYAMFIVVVFFIFLSSLIIVKILEKLKWIPQYNESMFDKTKHQDKH